MIFMQAPLLWHCSPLRFADVSVFINWFSGDPMSRKLIGTSFHVGLPHASVSHSDDSHVSRFITVILCYVHLQSVTSAVTNPCLDVTLTTMPI